MANATIYSNATSTLSWNSSTVDTDKTENSSTLVLNSSGATVYWTQGGSSGSFANTATLYCVQGAAKKKWNFSETSGGAARVTLTVTAGGGGSPAGKAEGQAHGNDDE
jgi:hypothetical protein